MRDMDLPCIAMSLICFARCIEIAAMNLQKKKKKNSWQKNFLANSCLIWERKMKNTDDPLSRPAKYYSLATADESTEKIEEKLAEVWCILQCTHSD